MDDQHEIQRYEGRIRSNNHLDLAVLDCGAQLFQCGPNEVLNVAWIFANPESPSFEAAQVQQIPEEAVQAFCLFARRVNQISMDRLIYRGLLFPAKRSAGQ